MQASVLSREVDELLARGIPLDEAISQILDPEPSPIPRPDPDHGE